MWALKWEKSLSYNDYKRKSVGVWKKKNNNNNNNNK